MDQQPYAERLGLAVAALVICWLLMILVREENQRYAMSLGMCVHDPVLHMPDPACLKNLETRTAWWRHVYYAAKEFGSP